MSKILASDYIMKFKNKDEIRSHFKRYQGNKKEISYTEMALSSELSNYALEHEFSEVDYSLIIEKYGKFHSVLLETLEEKEEEVTSPFWKEKLNFELLDWEASVKWLRRLENFAGVFHYLVSSPPKSFTEEIRLIMKMHQDINIHLGKLSKTTES